MMFDVSRCHHCTDLPGIINRTSTRDTNNSVQRRDTCVQRELAASARLALKPESQGFSAEIPGNRIPESL